MDELTAVEIIRDQLKRLERESRALKLIAEAFVVADLRQGIDEFLDMILDTALRLTETHDIGFGSILLKDRARNILVTRASVGLPEDCVKNEYPIGGDGRAESIVGWVAHTANPVRINENVSGDPRYYDAYEKDSQSELAVPLQDGGKVIGVLNLESPNTEVFDDDHLELLRTLAVHTVAAIKNLRLFQQTQEVSRLIQTINSSLDLDRVLESFYDSVERLTKARNMVILEYDVDEDILHLGPFLMRADDGAEKKLDVPLGHGVSGRAAAERCIIYKPNVLQLHPASNAYIQWIKNTKANLAIPIPLDETQQLIGVLNVESPMENAFDEVPRELFRIISDSAAIAISNARSNQRVINAQAYAILASAITGPFHDIVGNDIAIIPVLVEEIQEKCIEELKSPILRRNVADIRSSAKRALEFTRKLTYRFLPETSTVSTLSSELERAKADCAFPPDITLVPKYDQLTALLEVRGPLSTILRDLFRNSIAAMGADGTITIDAERKAEWLQISVTDNGRGIPEEQMHQLFEPGFTSNSARGIGFGLWAAKAIIETLGGTIRAQSKPGETIFTFRLPLAEMGENFEEDAEVIYPT